LPDTETGVPPVAHAGPRERSAQRWEKLLTELETRLEQWRAALDGDGRYPDDFRWPADLDRCPAHLADRARRVNAAQQDLQARMAMRRESLASLLRSDVRFGGALAAPLFVDQRT
jgi:hypothetical protein